MEFNNIGYTNKRQFLVYKIPHIRIDDEFIVFEQEFSQIDYLFDKNNNIVKFKFRYNGEKYNLYERYKNIHIYQEFNKILDNENIDKSIVDFIKKYGYLYTNKELIKLYNRGKEGKVTYTNEDYVEIKKQDFMNELYIFKVVQDLYNIISFYRDKINENIEIEPIKHWKLAFNRIVDYLYNRYEKTKKEIRDTFPNLNKKIFLTKNIYEIIEDMYAILISYYLENITVTVLEDKNEFITCLIPKNLIDVIYFDYFDYISNNGKNREVRMCEECNKIFYVDKTDGNDFRRKYCSIKCSKKYNAKKSNEKPIYKLYRSFYQKNHQNKHITFKQFNDWQEKALLLKKKCENKEITYKQYEDEMNELQNRFLKGDVKNGSIRKDKK